MPWLTVEEAFDLMERRTDTTQYATEEPLPDKARYRSRSILAGDMEQYVEDMPRDVVFSMTQVAKELQVNPKSLNQEFRKYCDALNIRYEVIPAQGFIIWS